MRKISLLIVNSLDKLPGKWYSKTRARPGFPDSFYINKGEKTMKRSEVNKALRELEAMETMEQYREADKAEKKMGNPQYELIVVK